MSREEYRAKFRGQISVGAVHFDEQVRRLVVSGGVSTAPGGIVAEFVVNLDVVVPCRNGLEAIEEVVTNIVVCACCNRVRTSSNLVDSSTHVMERISSLVAHHMKIPVCIREV